MIGVEVSQRFVAARLNNLPVWVFGEHFLEGDPAGLPERSLQESVDNPAHAAVPPLGFRFQGLCHLNI
jgi:hypothetical protein